jgi:hypothetical protein
MKQQQAGIIEAKAAIKRADEAVLQGRSIVVFTVFTIFFVSSRYLQSSGGPDAKSLYPAPAILHGVRIRDERPGAKQRLYTHEHGVQVHV